MGQCQSQELDSIIGKSVLVSEHDALVCNDSQKLPPLEEEKQGVCPNRQAIKRELSAFFLKKDENPLSPSEQTQKTDPETPTSMTTPGNKGLASMITTFLTPHLAASSSKITSNPNGTHSQLQTPKRALNSNQDFTANGSHEKTMQISSFIKDSLNLLDGLENIVIPEEIDPDAPSDEEDSFLRITEASNRENGVNDWEMEPGYIPLKKISPLEKISSKSKIRATSPPRPQSHIKSLHQRRVARPSSIQYHPPKPTTFEQTEGNHIKLVPNTPSSVEGDVLSQFKKLKVQVQLKEHEEKAHRRRAKYEDRYKDVQSYRRLYKEFEEIRLKSKYHEEKHSTIKGSCTDSRSFDLSQSCASHFEFSTMNSQEVKYDHFDTEDDQSQYSLLSTTSMESQRRYYTAKKRKNTMRRKSDTSESCTQSDRESMLEAYFEKDSSKNVSLVQLKQFGYSSENSNNRSVNHHDYGPVKHQQQQQSRNEIDDEKHQNEGVKAKCPDYGPIYVKTKKYAGMEDDVSVLSFNSIVSGNSRLSAAMQPSIPAEPPSMKITGNIQKQQMKDEHKTPKRSGNSELEDLSYDGMKRIAVEVTTSKEENLTCNTSMDKLQTAGGFNTERYNQCLNDKDTLRSDTNAGYDGYIKRNTKESDRYGLSSSPLKKNAIFTPNKILSDVDDAREQKLNTEKKFNCGGIIASMDTQHFFHMGKIGGFTQ